jgi:hypothetical protein
VARVPAAPPQPIAHLGAISKIQNALSYASAPFWMVA